MTDIHRRAVSRCKGGLVAFVTNPKVIQAFLTGAAFAVLGTGSGVVAYRTAPLTPLRPIEVKWLLILAIAAFWYWADNNQERFQELVEDATGEDVPDENKEDAYADNKG